MWQDELLPADMMVEHGGAQVALRDLPDIKNVPDIPTLAKNYVSTQSELGRRVRIPTKPEEAESWRKEHLPKLYSAGVLQGPPDSPDKYEIARPENLPEGLGWNDEFAAEARGILHKAGFTNDQVKVAMALHTQALAGVQQSLNVAKETVTKQLQEAWGDKYDENVAIAMRGADALFGEDKEATEFFNQTGILTHPLFLKKMHEIGAMSMEGNASINDGGKDSGVSAEESEVVAAMNVLNDLKHPDYNKFNTKEWNDKIDNYWKKKANGAQFVIS